MYFASSFWSISRSIFFSECPIGTFGSDCLYNCSGHCLGDVTCNRTIGRCHTGCKPGYTGELCDKGLIAYFKL